MLNNQVKKRISEALNTLTQKNQPGLFITKDQEGVLHAFQNISVTGQARLLYAHMNKVPGLQKAFVQVLEENSTLKADDVPAEN